VHALWNITNEKALISSHAIHMNNKSNLLNNQSRSTDYARIFRVLRGSNEALSLLLITTITYANPDVETTVLFYLVIQL
jgi:hypothetical protein